MFFHVLYATFKDGVVPDLYSSLSIRAESVERAVEVAVMDLEELYLDALFYAEPDEVVGVPQVVAVLNIETGKAYSVQHIESPYVKRRLSKESEVMKKKVPASIKETRDIIRAALTVKADNTEGKDTYAILYLIEGDSKYRELVFMATSFDNAIEKAKTAFRGFKFPVMLVVAHNWNTEERVALKEGFTKY